MKKDTYRLPTAEEAAAIRELRRTPAYNLCSIWLEKAIAGHPQPFTKTLRLGIGSVNILFKAAWVGLERGRPTIAAALADEDSEVSVALAVADLGAVVRLAPGVWTRHVHLACNLNERVLRAMELDRKAIAIADLRNKMDSAVIDAQRRNHARRTLQ